MVLCTGKEEGEKTPEAWGKNYRAAEGKEGRQTCGFREDNQRGTSTQRAGCLSPSFSFFFALRNICYDLPQKTVPKQQTQMLICMRMHKIFI